MYEANGPRTGTSTQTFKYHAFLSYSHADEALATRLHRALEAYVFPRRVRKALALPARLVPIFRDVDELEAASGLDTRLRDALDQSKWLLVLCSPAAAASRYVNQEIEYFVQRHGASRVLCVLGSGDPPACFPPAIRALGEEPLAADMRPGADFGLARLKLVAAIAGVGFTELRNREAQRRRRRRISAAALGAGLACGATATWELYAREHVDYFQGFVRRHGVWYGVDRVPAEDAAHRAQSYRFVRHGRLNPPDEVAHVDGRGECTPEGMRNVIGRQPYTDPLFRNLTYCTARFAYARDGSIRSETLLNRLGAPLEALSYTSPDLAQFTLEGYAASNVRSGIYYVQFARDAEGRDISVRFLHSRGVPRPNDDREFGYAFAYDPAGRLVRRESLDDGGKPTGEAVEWGHDVRGAVREQRYVDAQGRPRVHPLEGVAGWRHERDAWGNLLREMAFGVDGLPIASARGYAGTAYRRADDGAVVEEAFLDADGRPALDRQGVAGTRITLDPAGRAVRFEPFDRDGRITDTQGEAGLVARYDAAGNLLETVFLDRQGRPGIGRDGYVINRFRYDALGNMFDQDFRDAAGKLVLTRWGARIRLDFDERGNIVAYRFFDADDRPFVRPDRGAAAHVLKRDERGNTVEVLALGADLKPIMRRDGYARVEMEFDDAGNEIERRHFDASDRPVTRAEGYSIRRSRFDRVGNVKERRYLAPDRRPVRHRDEGFGWNAEYDRRARMTQQTFVDASGAPAPLRRGHAIVRYEHDALGRVAAESYLDVDGKPLRAPHAAGLAFEHDRYSNEILRRYVDALGNTVPGPDGFAILRTSRDAFGAVESEECLDPSGKPVDRADGGWARKTYRYAPGAAPVETLFDARGRELTSPAPPGTRRSTGR